MDSTYLTDSTTAGAVLAVFAAFALLFIVIGIIFYLFFSIGLYKLAKNDGDDIAWMAFIPVAQYYTMGNLIKGNFTIFGGRINRIEIILPVAMFVGGALSAIPFLGLLVAIALLVLYISAVYHLFKKYKGEKATMFTVLSVIFSFLYPFFIFGMRNSMPVDISYGAAGNKGNGFQNNYNPYNNNFNQGDNNSNFSYDAGNDNDFNNNNNGGNNQD